MNDSSFLNRFFDYDEVGPDQEFDLSRKSRFARLHEMLQIMRRHHFMQGFTPEEFRETLEELGPSYVKVGQTLSTRSEILPQAYCDELAKLQSECDPLPFKTVLATLDRIYGGKLNEIFTYIDPHPLGSASLAQVHRAELKTGDIVAVKVQRPGVRKTMAQDIDMMRSLARHGENLMKGNQIVNLRGVMEELWTIFLEETDFKKEAENLEEFGRLNKNVAYIRCPRPYPEYCTAEVLVMEYIDGISIRDTETLKEYGYDLSEIGDKLLDNYATQVLEHGFFHADPHPGNIYIKGGQIVYMDLGIMGRLTPTERAQFGNIINAVGHKSASMLKDALLAFSVSGDLSTIDHPRLLASLDVIISQYASADVADIDIGAFLTDIVSLMRSCHVELPASLTSVARGIVTLEGTLLRYVGDFNMVDIINTHIERTRFNHFDPKGELQSFWVRLDRTARGLERAADDAGDVMHTLSRGQLKFNMELLGSEEPMHDLMRIVNRLIVGMIIVGLLVSGSLLDGPMVGQFGVLTIVEYTIAVILSIWLLVDAFRQRKK